MGQRLVIDLIENDKTVAAIYYHWSAYFCSTVEELAKLSRTILEAERTGQNKLLAVVNMLETLEEVPYRFPGQTETVRRGGVQDPVELETAKTLFPEHEFATEYVNRNCGVIVFTDVGINNYHLWEEGHAEINLDTHEITNSVDLDADPFEFVDVEYETDEDGEKYIHCLYSGRIKINGKENNIDPFDCTCETIIELMDFMNYEYKVYMEKQK